MTLQQVFRPARAGAEAEALAAREMNRWLLEALDHVAAAGGTQPGAEEETAGAILTQAGSVLFRICPFEGQAIYLLDPAAADFPVAWCEPGGDQSALQAELDAQIRDGVFAWALQRTNPVIVPARQSPGSVMLHVLGTRSGPLGMFLGTMAARAPFIPDGCQKLVSIVLNGCAAQIRSQQLRAELQHINRNLEATIEQRTVELRHARDAAFRAAQAKTEFLANMSHEIRTPMNAVLGTAAMLLESGLTEEQRSLAETIAASGRGLLTIINDILDFAKLEAGKLRVESIAFDLHEAVRGVVTLLRPRAEARPIRLDLRIAPEVPVQVQGDPGRLRQILTNVIDNAIKFTEHGFVMVHVDRAGPAAPEQIRFVVRDTGIGIAPEKLGLIFEKFTQADTSTTRRYGGTGLGLTICRQLAEVMGGSITAASSVGSGSTFTITLPLPALAATAPAPEATPASAPSRLDGRVLLAEDYPANQRIARWMLEKLGLSVEIAADGKQVLERLAEGEFDLVLMDCQMPELDGYDATRAIRAGDEPRRSIPIVAMTAAALPADRERCLAAGMNDYISKPVQQEELARVLARWLRT